MDMVPSCQNCFYHAPGLYSDTGFCIRSIVYRGRGKIIYDFASNARSDESRCGPSARLFVPVKKGETLVLDDSTLPQIHTREDH